MYSCTCYFTCNCKNDQLFFLKWFIPYLVKNCESFTSIKAVFHVTFLITIQYPFYPVYQKSSKDMRMTPYMLTLLKMIYYIHVNLGFVNATSTETALIKLIELLLNLDRNSYWFDASWLL